MNQLANLGVISIVYKFGGDGRRKSGLKAYHGTIVDEDGVAAKMNIKIFLRQGSDQR